KAIALPDALNIMAPDTTILIAVTTPASEIREPTNRNIARLTSRDISGHIRAAAIAIGTVTEIATGIETATAIVDTTTANTQITTSTETLPARKWDSRTE